MFITLRSYDIGLWIEIMKGVCFMQMQIHKFLCIYETWCKCIGM